MSSFFGEKFKKKRGRTLYTGSTLDETGKRLLRGGTSTSTTTKKKKKKKKKKKPFLSFFLSFATTSTTVGDTRKRTRTSREASEVRDGNEDVRGAHPSQIDANDCGRARERVEKRAQVGRGTTVRVSADDERGDRRRRRGGFEKEETITFPVPIGDVPYRGGETSDDATETRCTTTTNEGRDDPTYILAKSYFDLGEYRRCAFIGDVFSSFRARETAEDVS